MNTAAAAPNWRDWGALIALVVVVIALARLKVRGTALVLILVAVLGGAIVSVLIRTGPEIFGAFDEGLLAFWNWARG